MTLAAFAGIALIHLLAAISPGPSFVLSVRTAAGEGFSPAAGLALGFGIGASLWALAALAGLTLLFELAPWLFAALKIVGGIFLVWLAIRMWRHASDPMPVLSDAAPRSAASAIRLGLATFLANPKPAVFFGAIFVGLVPAQADLAARAIIVGNVFAVETNWYLATAAIFSRPAARAAYIRFKTALDRAFGGVLGALGAKIAIS